MTGFTSDIVRVIKNDNSRFFALLLVLVGYSVEVSRIVRDTYFLQTAGAERIPWAYVAFAILMIAASTAYARATRRFALRRLMLTTLAVAAVTVFSEWVLIYRGSTSIALAYALFCAVELCFIFVPMTVWAVANGAFSVAEGERTLPILGSFGLTGTVLGGVTARTLSPIVGPYNLLLLASITFCIAALHAIRAAAPEPEAASSLSMTAASRPRSLWSEPLVRTLTYLACPLWVVAYLIEYSYYAATDHAFTDATELARFLGLFVSLCSAGAFAIQVWGTPILVRVLGVGNACFIYPVVLALGALMTLIYTLFPSELTTMDGLAGPAILVLGARFLDMAVYQSVYDSSSQVLFYAVPPDTRARARALVTGMVLPASIAVAGILLIIFRSVDEPVYNVAFTAVAVGFLLLTMGLDITPDYLRSLIAHADLRDEERSSTLRKELERLSSNEARYVLLQVLAQGTEDQTSFALDKLFEDYDETLAEELLELDGELTPAILEEVRERIKSARLSA